jgi:hypothetical protein
MAKRLKVGVIGLGTVAQIIHLPILKNLSDLYEIAALCDISRPLYSWKRMAFMKGILMVTIDSPPLTAASHSASLVKREE